VIEEEGNLFTTKIDYLLSTLAWIQGDFTSAKWLINQPLQMSRKKKRWCQHFSQF